MKNPMPILGAAALASFTLAACTAPTVDDEGATGNAQEQVVADNAIVANAIVANAIVANAIVANAIVANAIVANAIVANAIVANALTDPNARELFKYVVSCALTPDQSVTLEIEGTTYTFSGELGLAPQWGMPNGSCNASCQEWVSACVISRVDYLGVSKQISLRGQNPALETTTVELATYTEGEATYWGNIFASPQRIYGCLAPGKTQIPRVCGPSIDDCVVDVVGDCADVCGRPRADGSFPNCRSEAGDDGHGRHRDHDRMNHASITVFLQP